MTFLITKVSLPERRKDVLRRIRLIDSLHENLHRKLTFVSAPAGYGKTTLLVDFANDVDAVVCWYHIGFDDAGLVSFSRYFVAAFRQQFTNFGDGLSELLGTSGNLSPQSVAAEIINEIVEHVDDYCVLILDDFHIVGENQPIVDFMEAFLAHLPTHVRLVIASRSIYGIPSSRLYVHDELATLGANDLRFRPDELQALVRQSHRFILSDEQAAELAARSDGWIVAIMLAIRAMKQGNLPKFEEAIDQVYTFLAEEVVNQQHPHLQEFLLATSILDELNETLCNFLLEITSAGQLLNEVRERNLFVTRIETSQGINYRYHQLFSDFLSNHLAKTDPEKMRALQARAAEWYREHEAWELAVRHILAADEPETAARWMDLAATDFFANGRQNVLSQWYESLKTMCLLDHSPRLLLNRAKMLINQSEFQQAQELLQIAEPVFQKENDTDQVVNAIITKGMIYRYQGDFKNALMLGDEAQRILTSVGKEDSYWWYQADRLKGISQSYFSKADEAIEYLQSAVKGFRNSQKVANNDYLQPQPEHDLAETLNDLGVIYIGQGSILEAQRCFLDALEIRRKSRGNQSALAIALNNVGYIHYQTGNYAEAWHSYEEALENARLPGWDRILVGIHNSRGDLLRDINEMDAAETAYSIALEIATASNEKIEVLDTYYGLSELEKVQENFQQAFHWLRQAALSKNDNEISPTYRTGLGGIYLEMGQLDLARNAFEQALLSWNDLEKPLQEQVKAIFLLGNTYFKQNKTEKALEFLAKALKWSAQLGYDQFLIVLGTRCQAFLAYALQVWPENAQLKSLVQRTEQMPTGLASLHSEEVIAEVPEMHIEIRAFGRGEVRIDGELVPRSKWRSSGARALFFFFVHQQGVRKEDVGLEFWPEFSSSKISSNFHATLWRVRKALGEREIITFLENEYRINPAVTIWYDVAEFSFHIEQAEAPELSPTNRAEHWRQAITLYQGDYLEDIFMNWSVQRADELRNMYIHALTNLAEWEASRNHNAVAIALYEKVLDIEPYLDNIHLTLMKCLANSGSPSGSKAHYHKYKEFLRRELNTEPSRELQVYYDQLSRQE